MSPSKTSHSQPKSPADILAEIAALPLEDNADTFSGRDHDKVVYPDRGRSRVSVVT